MEKDDGTCSGCGQKELERDGFACKRWSWYIDLARKEFELKKKRKPVCWYPLGCSDVFDDVEDKRKA